MLGSGWNVVNHGAGIWSRSTSKVSNSAFLKCSAFQKKPKKKPKKNPPVSSHRWGPMRSILDKLALECHPVAGATFGAWELAVPIGDGKADIRLMTFEGLNAST